MMMSRMLFRPSKKDSALEAAAAVAATKVDEATATPEAVAVDTVADMIVKEAADMAAAAMEVNAAAVVATNNAISKAVAAGATEEARPVVRAKAAAGNSSNIRKQACEHLDSLVWS